MFPAAVPAKGLIIVKKVKLGNWNNDNHSDILRGIVLVKTVN